MEAESKVSVSVEEERWCSDCQKKHGALYDKFSDWAWHKPLPSIGEMRADIAAKAAWDYQQQRILAAESALAERDAQIAEIVAQQRLHDWTHAADSCDAPDCDHVTRRTCEGAEKVIKFLRGIVEGLRKRLYKADPAAVAADWNRLMQALDMPDEYFEEESPNA